MFKWKMFKWMSEMFKWRMFKWMSFLDGQLGRRPSEIPWPPPLAWWRWACFAAFMGGAVWVATLVAKVAG